MRGQKCIFSNCAFGHEQIAMVSLHADSPATFWMVVKLKSAAWTGNLGHVLSKQSKFYHFPVYCTLFQVLPLWKQLEFVCREVCLYNFRQLQISASDQKNPKDVFGVKPYLWSASPNNCQQSLANHLGIPIFPQKMLHHIQYGGCDTTPVRLL